MASLAELLESFAVGCEPGTGAGLANLAGRLRQLCEELRSAAESAVEEACPGKRCHADPSTSALMKLAAKVEEVVKQLCG